MKTQRIFLVAGARPNFMKIAPIIRALNLRRNEGAERPGGSSPPKETREINPFDYRIVHTGQHYDYEMSKAFFHDLDIPKPDYYLNAGSGSHAEQTAKIMIEFEKVCLHDRPDLVIVVGDVNSTLACSITAKKLLIRVAHVEAGLRSGDMSMPEEINRIVTDSIADYLFVTEKSGMDNLLKEGRLQEAIFFVGHVMIDNLFHQLTKLNSEDLSGLSTYRIKQELGKYVFLTLHRPSNVDSKKTLEGIVEALNEISSELPIVFPVHPRTKRNLERFNIKLSNQITTLPPLGFRESLFLWKDAAVVMTDSGGLQEETTVLGIPCLTLRDRTERPITVEMGTNTIAGNKKEGILFWYHQIVEKKTYEAKAVPPKWDGKAAERIIDILKKVLSA